MAALVCVASSIVDDHFLEAAGVELRRGQECTADAVFFQEGGTTAAFVNLEHITPAALDRVAKAGKAFKRTFVLMPNAALQDAAYLEASCRLGVAESLTFITMPLGASFTQHALQLAAAVVDGAAAEGAWRQEQAGRVESSEAAARVLAALPLPAGEPAEAQHLARMLRMLGSVAQVSRCGAAQLAAAAGLARDDATALAAFFSARLDPGDRPGTAAAAGAPAPRPLPSL